MFRKNNKFKLPGYSIIEMLVVIAVFAVMAILLTQSLALTFKGSRKSEATISAQADVRYAMAIIERGLYNAESIETTCDGSSVDSIDYIDQFHNQTSFSCDDDGSVGLIASGSARLTTPNTDIVTCSFACNQGSGNSPDEVVVTISAESVSPKGAEGAVVDITNRILLRSY